MRFNKILNFILVFILSVCCVFPIVGCSNNSGSVEPIIFNPLYDELDVFEQYEFELLDGIDESSVKWEITEGYENVELKDNTVFAIGLGYFTIKATYGEKEQVQKVHVVQGDDPTIIIEDLPLLIGSTFKISPLTTYKNKIINDIVYTLSSASTECVAVNGLTLSALKKGESVITVSAYYKDLLVSSATFVCTVNTNQGIIPNKAEYKLYLCDNFLGESFDKELPITAGVYKDGVLVENAFIEWTIADENVAKIMDGKVVAVSLGETTLKGVSSVDCETIETVNIPVSVNTALIGIDTPVIIDLSKETHTFSDTMFGVEQKVGFMINNKNSKSYNVSNNQISTGQFMSGEYNYTIYSENKAYAIDAQVVIADYVVSDLESLQTMYKYENGYIAMSCDVEINGAYSAAADDKVTFGGTFNGLGHKIIGMEFRKGSTGLFHMTNGATIKNVGFTGAKITKESNNAIICYQARGSLTLDNVYIDVTMALSSSSDSFNGGVVGLLFQGVLNLNNSIIICKGLNRNGEIDANNGGLLGRNTGTVVMNDSFVITDGYACSKKPQENNTQFERINNLKGIYSSEEDFLSDKENEYVSMNFSGFNEKYWDLTNVPIYK